LNEKTEHGIKTNATISGSIDETNLFGKKFDFCLIIFNYEQTEDNYRGYKPTFFKIDLQEGFYKIKQIDYSDATSR